MAEFGFSQATTWEKMQAVHAQFMHDYNTQKHVAHLKRKDGKHSPQAVLGWVKGIWCDATLLARLFQLRADRWFDQNGYLQFRHWRIYAERGLAGRLGATWLFGDVLSLTYKDELLAQYQLGFAPDGRHIQAVNEPRLFPNRYPSPQCYLPGVERDWPLAVYLPPPAMHRRVAVAGKQVRMAFSS
jgi:hypothetical protein